MAAPSAPLLVGRYAIYDELAAGGMGTVHIGRLLGAAGFARTVAIKRLHPQLARDEEFVDALLDEARLAARIRHPSVVPTLDVVARGGELFVVMEYVAGESLAALIRATKGGPPLPIGCVLAIVSGTLAGLHAAHEATDERGEPLLVVHRDVSPQNVLVGQDGVARVLDFGIAKAMGRKQQTGEGVIKGKLGYMPPEQIRAEGVDRRADIYAAGIVLWEALTSRRLFQADSDWATVNRIFSGVREPPSLYRAEVPPALDDIILKACHVDPRGRFATAEEFAAALDDLKLAATPRDVRELVIRSAGERLAERARRVAAMEHASLTELPALEASDVSAIAADARAHHPAVAAVGAAAPRRGRALGVGLGGLTLALALAVGVTVATRRGALPADASAPPASASEATPPEARAAAAEPTATASSPPLASAPSSASAAPSAAATNVAPPAAVPASPKSMPSHARPRGVFDNRH